MNLHSRTLLSNKKRAGERPAPCKTYHHHNTTEGSIAQMKNVRCHMQCEHNVSGWCHADIIIEVQGGGVLMHYCPVRPDFASPFADEVDPMLRFDERDLPF